MKSMNAICEGTFHVLVAISGNPKGVAVIQPRVGATAPTLGQRQAKPTLTGLNRLTREISGFNPFRVEQALTKPMVARSSQPWAGCFSSLQDEGKAKSGVAQRRNPFACRSVLRISANHTRTGLGPSPATTATDSNLEQRRAHHTPTHFQPKPFLNETFDLSQKLTKLVELACAI